MNKGNVKEWREKQKLRLANIIASRLNLGLEDKKALNFMIKTINFKQLHRNGSNELIICALSFYCLKTRKSNVQLEHYSLFKEYGLNYKTYSTIITHLANYYQKKMLQRYVNI